VNTQTVNKQHTMTTADKIVVKAVAAMEGPIFETNKRKRF
jgi:hypothetical protein